MRGPALVLTERIAAALAEHDVALAVDLLTRLAVVDPAAAQQVYDVLRYPPITRGDRPTG